MAFIQVLAVALALFMCGSASISNSIALAEVEELEDELQNILEMEQQFQNRTEMQGMDYEHAVTIQSAMNPLINALNGALDQFHSQIGANPICNFVGALWSKVQSGNFKKEGSVLSLNSKSHNTINLQKVLPIARFNIKISSASFDCSTKILKLNIAQTGLIMIIPNFMTIDKMQVSLQADMTSISQTLQIDIHGIWKVGNLNIVVTLAYSRSTGITTVTATPDSKTTIQSFMRSVLGLSLPINPSVTFSIKFEGQITPNGLTTLTLANANGNNKYYGIYQKEGKTPAAKGFATEIQRIKLSTAIKKVINVDISGVPFFGTFSVNNLDLTFATKRITSLNLGSLSKSQLLQKLGYTIKKGLTAFIGVPFHKDPLTLTYHNKVLVMTTPKKDLRLDKILSSIVPGSTKLSLPSQLSQIFKVNIETITVRPRQMTINLAYPGALKFADGILSFSQAKVALVIAKTTPKVKTTVSGIINLGGIKFNTRLAPNKQGKYVLTASTNMLNMNALINSLHAAVLPDTISGFMKGIPFLNFKLKNPTMSYTIGVKPLQIKLGGKPIIAGFSTTNTESLIVKTATGTKTILGFELGQLNFADLLMKVTKFNFGGIFPLLKQSITATVTISPISSNKLHFGVGKLASLPVSSGVSITATMHFPKHCDPKDSFCKFAGRLMGSIPLTLKASFASSSEFLIAAYINKLKLSDKITLQSAGLEIVAGKIPRIGLKGSVQLNKPPLLFTASISASTKGLTLKLSVSNCWKKAFEVEWLTLCDFTGSVDFAPPTGIVGFAFGAKIHLGYPNSGHQIQAAGYMGVNIIYPIANYYYVKFTRVTMGSLLKAFNIRFTLPKPLADSGFPEGFLSSFSALGQNLPDAHLSIPPGYRLKGTLDILGFRASADITIDLPKLIDVNVALPAIRVGNLLAMYASASDARKGPYLKAKVQLLPNQYVNIEAKGYLKVLGIALQSSLKITNSHYMYSISGKILHLFEASMDITAPYGNIHHAVFRVKGEFKLDLFKGIINLSKQLFTNKGNIANAAIGKAKQVYQHALNAYNSARRVLDKAKSLLSRLRIRQAMIQEFENCSSSNTCKKAVVQGWFRRTVRRVSRAATRTVRTISNAAKRLKEKALQAFNSAKDAVNRAQRVFSDALRKFNDAKNHLSRVQQQFKNGLKVFEYIKKFGSGGIMSIQRLYFDVSLGSASGGNFAGGVELRFLGHYPLKTSVSFNLRHLSSLAKTLFDKVMNKIKNLFG